MGALNGGGGGLLLTESFFNLRKLRFKNRVGRTLALQNFCIIHLKKEKIFCYVLHGAKQI